ncbi:hypothetical protein AgCh_027735 [Apium graveolens]
MFKIVVLAEDATEAFNFILKDRAAKRAIGQTATKLIAETLKNVIDLSTSGETPDTAKSTSKKIKTVRHPESGKPAFRWLGMKQKSSNAHDHGSGSNDTMMRVFGTEIANTASKRFTDSISNCRSSEKVHVLIYAKQVNVETEDDENSSKQHQGNLPKDPERGEPALRRLVIKQNSSIGSDSYDTRRRVFGSEITNTASKRFKDNSLSKCRSSENVIMPTYAKQHNVQK